MSYGINIRNAMGTPVLTPTDTSVFYVDTIHLSPSDGSGSKEYPNLKGATLYVNVTYDSGYSSSYDESIPDVEAKENSNGIPYVEWGTGDKACIIFVTGRGSVEADAGAYGFRILNDNNELLVSDKTMNLRYFGKAQKHDEYVRIDFDTSECRWQNSRFAYNKWFRIYGVGNTPPVVFIELVDSGVNEVANMWSMEYLGGGDWEVFINHYHPFGDQHYSGPDPILHVFRTYTTVWDSSYGLVVYNSDGSVAFHHDGFPLVLHSVHNLWTPTSIWDDRSTSVSLPDRPAFLWPNNAIEHEEKDYECEGIRYMGWAHQSSLAKAWPGEIRRRPADIASGNNVDGDDWNRNRETHPMVIIDAARYD